MKNIITVLNKIEDIVFIEQFVNILDGHVPFFGRKAKKPDLHKNYLRIFVHSSIPFPLLSDVSSAFSELISLF